MKNPDISVVMSVYNGSRYLRRSVESILSQEGSDFEFIIVNDGSTDESGSILAEYAAADRRLRVIDQENTWASPSALIRGCAQARGEYIARQDVGDISCPDRLVKQFSCIRNNREASLVSCGTRYTRP